MGTNLKMYVIRGIAASPGIVRGRAVILKKRKLDIEPVPVDIKSIDSEINGFQNAIKKIKRELKATAAAVEKRLGVEFSRIFEAQAMIAGDDVVAGEVVKQIKTDKVSAAYIYYQHIKQVIDALGKSPDSYLKERIADIESVSQKVLSALVKTQKTAALEFDGPAILIADDLSPSDLLGFSVKQKIGFATETGGKTSHTALLAKSLNIPAVVGAGDSLADVAENSQVILDGYKGVVIVNPDKKTLTNYQATTVFVKSLEKELNKLKSSQTITEDGVRIALRNNIEIPTETNKVLKSGAEGVGLFRTEYLFLKTSTFPSLARQYRIYKSILEKMSGLPVTIRTFDIGGDKFGDKRVQTIDPNPFLGWRAIRYCLDNPELFADQLEALLKASPAGNLEIMLPFISNLDEIAAAKKLLEDCRKRLKSNGVEYSQNIPLGIMVEVPSAVILADKLAKEVDFFSIGTNDLIQYTLAVDRTNKMISNLYQSLNPAVLLMIKQTIDSGRKHGIKVSVCGEMATDPYGVIILAGLGISELSVNYQFTGIIKRIVRGITFEKAAEIAQEACSMGTATEVEKMLQMKIAENFKEIVPLIEFIKGGRYD